MKKIEYSKFRFLIVWLAFLPIIQCNQVRPTPKARIDSAQTIHKKPSSSYKDTLIIDSPVALFYQPDAMQLDSIKLVTDARVYAGSMHEYYYQVRNAHNVLKQNWPQISILDSKNVRYLKFVKENMQSEIIDLNEYNDAYGMFIFDPKKSPVLVDMTNLEDAIYFYFGK